MSSHEFNLAMEHTPGCVDETLQLQTMLDSGVLINVTAWATRQMTFPTGRYRVTVALTAKIWRVLHAIPDELTFFQTVRGRGHDVLWLAAWVLKRALLHGQDCAIFLMPLPTSADDEDAKALRIEYSVAPDGRPYVIIGMAEEFPLI